MAILTEGLAFHERQDPLARRTGARGRKARRPGHNLLVRLRDYRDDVLRFLTDFTVPFTNNQAERDLRMMKLRMKSRELSAPSRARRSSLTSDPSSRRSENTGAISSKHSPYHHNRSSLGSNVARATQNPISDGVLGSYQVSIHF
ncbi:IS66 family transposase [Octadecabacter arcticus]|uniref:IS66 family transposase n=1 Tax=Octadecabacter arcticus TaxID=53946 RepID=UPI0001808A9D|nr:transposase [Octadecabacter arcticus]